MAQPLTRLRVLSLEGNRLTEAGLLVLAQGLAGHPSLSELHLADQNTPISLKAVEGFIEMMEQVKGVGVEGEVPNARGGQASSKIDGGSP
eukprot:scaffold3420_cov115-Isochrysis_galbana.AAC.1